MKLKLKTVEQDENYMHFSSLISLQEDRKKTKQHSYLNKSSHKCTSYSRFMYTLNNSIF